MIKLLIINGPNLNLLGKREPNVYGNTSMEVYFEALKAQFQDVELTYFQSNVEGEMINKIHEFGFAGDGIILNAGGYTHTSVALADAISAIKTPVIEVHISNTAKRESFRHHSYISPVCIGTIAGFGMDSYRLAVEAFIHKSPEK